MFLHQTLFSIHFVTMNIPLQVLRVDQFLKYLSQHIEIQVIDRYVIYMKIKSF